MKRDDLKKFLNIVESKLSKVILFEHEESLAIISANLKDLVSYVSKSFPELKNIQLGKVEIVKETPVWEYQVLSKDIMFNKNSILSKIATKGQLKFFFIENLDKKLYEVTIFLMYKDVDTNRMVNSLLISFELDFAGKIK